MNAEDEAEDILPKGWVDQGYGLKAKIIEALTTLKRETVEKCARVAEDMWNYHGDMVNGKQHAKGIAAAIRKIEKEAV